MSCRRVCNRMASSAPADAGGPDAAAVGDCPSPMCRQIEISDLAQAYPFIYGRHSTSWDFLCGDISHCVSIGFNDY